MSKAASPAVLLLGLLLAGIGAGVWLSLKNEAKPAAPPKSVAESDKAPAEGSAEDLQMQIALLEGQVEYLQGQVGALQDENAELLQKLGSLGMKGTPQMEPLPRDDLPDFVGMGLDMMKLRQLQALPIATTVASQAEVEAAILAWLQRQQPGDAPHRLALALAALGWIPKPVDVLKLRAAILVRQMGGWYDEQTETILRVDDGSGAAIGDEALTVAYGQLLREFGPTLFPRGASQALTTDERLARESLLAGDACLTRFLFGLQNPQVKPANDLPAEDPDHPLNEVPMPVYLRELSLFPTLRGFDFAQSLHSAGAFPQLNAAYSRPPASTAEVIEPERYLDQERLPTPRIDVPHLRVLDTEPFWDDRLGRYACFAALRAHNSDEDAGKGARGWQSDRLLAYAAPDAGRDHAAWQTLWVTSEDAEAFFKAMSNSLTQRYDAKPVAASPDAVEWQAQGRFVHLRKNREGAGVLLIDAASADFASALRAAFEAKP